VKGNSRRFNRRVAKVWKRVWSGIWRHAQSKTLYERPKLVIDGKERWTFRSLCTASLEVAKKELYHRKSARSAAREGFGDGVLPARNVTVGDVIRRYQKDGYPDRQRKVRPELMQKSEAANSDTLLGFWDQHLVTQIRIAVCDRYHDWRCEQIERGTGDRTVDLELNTLNNALVWACRVELISINPLADGRPTYCSSKAVHHCREFMPLNVDELHAAARLLMSKPKSVVLGFQTLVEGLTGLRTCETLLLRRNAKPNEPGWCSEDGKSLYVWRAKGQENVSPCVLINEGLRETLAALDQWIKDNYPDSPWFFPSPLDPSKPVHKDSLGQALRRLRERLPRKLTPHGNRGLFVTVRRSHGILDSQIAHEIGHTSAGRTLAQCYGGVPSHWLTGDGPKLSWLPTGKPAWSVLGTDEKAATTPTTDQSESGIVTIDFRASGTSQPSTGNAA
jgi:hypothetical protein